MQIVAFRLIDWPSYCDENLQPPNAPVVKGFLANSLNHMRHIRIFVVIILSILSADPLYAESDLVRFAKSLTAKDYDDSLPSIPIEQWLLSVLPHDYVVKWGKNITACGEQRGNPSIDQTRYLPLCAEVELTANDTSKGYLLLWVATQKKGKLKEPALYLGFMKFEKKTIYLKTLSEIERLDLPDDEPNG